MSNNNLILKKYQVKNFIFYKINKIEIILNRVEIDKKSFTIKLTESEKKKIINLEKRIRLNLPQFYKLKSNLIDNTIKTNIFRSKNILQTNIINNNHTSQDINWGSIEIFIDNLYSFENNPKLIFYKIKLKNIEYLD